METYSILLASYVLISVFLFLLVVFKELGEKNE